MNPEKLDHVIDLLIEARSVPEAQSIPGHIERADRIYALLHRASETLVLDCIQEVWQERDTFKRIQRFQD